MCTHADNCLRFSHRKEWIVSDDLQRISKGLGGLSLVAPTPQPCWSVLLGKLIKANTGMLSWLGLHTWAAGSAPHLLLQRVYMQQAPALEHAPTSA